MIRVLLADRLTLVREGLSSVLSQHRNFEFVAPLDDGALALDAIRRECPDVAVLDQTLPTLSGIDVIEQAIALGLRTRFILLSDGAEVFVAQQALRAGAHGVVSKSDEVLGLVDAIREVNRGNQYLTKSLVPSSSQYTETLTGREREILDWVARGLSSAQVAAELGISLKNVDTHRSRLMRKLGTHSVAALVGFALRSGLVHV